MRLTPTTAAAALALAALLPLARPARAQLGAIAYDRATGQYGMSWNRPNPKSAIAVAISRCGATGCRVVIRLHPRQCGAIASAGNPKGFGAAARPSLDQARLAAMTNCRKANSGECVVKISQCNK